MVAFGIDVLTAAQAGQWGRMALLTAPSGRTAAGQSTVERLAALGDLRLLLAPEHGVRGDKGAGETFASGVDRVSGLPMVSLYSGGKRELPPEVFQQFDTLVYDIQDVGCRYYTFISSLLGVMKDCARAGKHLAVLDRPDPLGDACEGTLLQEDCRSFVGCWPMPARYGLSCGEFARMANRELGLECELTVVPCRGLRRGMTWRQWERIWVMPSLAMPRYETALLYPGTCLFEGTNCSEGRGTADPFGILGAPFVQSEELSRAFNDRRLPGVESTPVWFTPTASKHQGVLCGGIQLHITDERALRPVELGLHLLDLFRTLYPRDFAFLPPAAGRDKPFVSLLLGNRELERENWALEPLLSRGREESRLFSQKTEEYRIYD